MADRIIIVPNPRNLFSFMKEASSAVSVRSPVCRFGFGSFGSLVANKKIACCWCSWLLAVPVTSKNTQTLQASYLIERGVDFITAHTRLGERRREGSRRRACAVQ